MQELLGSAQRLEVAGVETYSGCAWPGRLTDVVLLQGCPWQCGYCDSFNIIDPQAPGTIVWADVLAELRTRRKLLDGVVFSGGEPTRQPALKQAVTTLKDLGFEMGLHTGGAYPNRLAALLPALDWVGLDIKAPSAKYQAVTGVATDDSAPMECLKMILKAGVPVQVRTTLDPLTLDEDDVLEIQERVMRLGVTDFVVQRVRTQGTNPQYALALQDYRAAASIGTPQVILPNQ